jgi:glycosyltransferase involved in cell wall biosynthesis
MSPEDPPDVSVVVPVYRNAPTLRALVNQVGAVISDLGLAHEMVFVNDASPDDSLARLRELALDHPEVTLVDLPVNIGQHAAVLHGLARARGRTCVVMDADLQDRPASLAVLWRARTPGVEAVFGGRRGDYESRGRLATSWLFKRALSRLTGIPSDAGIFVLMERSLVDRLAVFPTRVPWIQAMIGCLGVATVSIPVERDRRADGRSSYSGAARLRTALRALLCVVEYHAWRPRQPYLDAATPLRSASSSH